MPVNTISNPANTAAECALITDGNPDVTQGGGDYMNGCGAFTPNTSTRVVVRQLPSVARCILPLTGGVHWAANRETGQYAVTLHVGDTLTLSPLPANAQNQETVFTSPAGNIGFLFSSRQTNVVSLNVDKNTFVQSAIATAQDIGTTTIEIVSPVR